MLFRFLLTQCSKSEPFSCLHEVDHVTNYRKRPLLLNFVPQIAQADESVLNLKK